MACNGVRIMSEVNAKKSWRPAAYWRLADKFAGELFDFLPASVRSAAMATCRFHFRGKESHRNGAYAMAVHTEMQTFGHCPNGCSGGSEPACQERHHWVQLTSKRAADMILDHFGLTLEEVFSRFGKPNKMSEIKLSLYEILDALVPNMIDDEIRTGCAIVAA